ncbi:MAG: alanine--tRNA ligase [Deltaproteobacteria bacterium]|nr:alanine--tRNA ligase [Candidatus Anaeroferrophillus wilburensis]MBN2888633.1 alanine--tRNA ligase [Deltaproteobacteria bacterium]
MTGNEIRQKFLAFFQEHDHAIVKSSGLIPLNDPTLLFTNAGMNQFKDVFLGLEKRDYQRATTAQKCVRAGGKHNDLENVGRTARHHTFFEMLGNFSFGDYFKEGAIRYAWEFLTVRMGLPTDKLWVTVFRDDDEAYDLWKEMIGVPADRIVRMGEKDNFWAMGDTGPCGPCSEILIDQGEEMSCGDQCGIGLCECDRYLEIWNLVFMQYNRDAAGVMNPLPKPSIDTGMGLERLAAVVQGVKSNYDTDLLRGIIAAGEKLAGKTYGEDADHDVSLRVLADHSRATAFLIADGVLPSNEGRGYVLRRIMRRAARHGKLLGIHEPFLYRLAETVADQMQEAYPDLAESLPFVTRVIENEEKRFGEALDRGLKILDEELAKLRQNGERVLSGEVVFRLYDTFGFPVDLTEDIVEKEQVSLDHAGFEAQMEAQQEKSRQSWKGSGEEAVGEVYKKLAQEGIATEFVGYDRFQESGKVLCLLKDGEQVSRATVGQQVEIIFDRTPFYGESGGQVGDQGRGDGDGFVLDIKATSKPLEAIFVHHAVVTEGSLALGDSCRLTVSEEERLAIQRHHSATHLLQAKLQHVLGEHVKQAGSLVSAERLRFDFSHFTALTDEELLQVEALVNREIMANLPVSTEITTMEEAVGKGAMAIFGEKYGDQVRMVAMGGASVELCGGTHVGRTGDIGFFKIISESGIAAGVRRIEALAGMEAWRQVVQEEKILKQTAAMLKGAPAEVPEKITRLQEQFKEQQREIARLKDRLRAGPATQEQGAAALETVNGIPLLVSRVECDDPKEMRQIMDVYKQKNPTGITVLGAVAGGKALLIAHVADSWQQQHPAGKIIAHLAAMVGGKGGGRPELAQAGGPEVNKLDEALAQVKELMG